MRTAKYIRHDHPLTQALMIVGVAMDRIAQDIRVSSSRQGCALMKNWEKTERIYAYLSAQHRNTPGAWWEVSA